MSKTTRTTKKSAATLKVQHAIMSNAGHKAWITTYQTRLAKTRDAAKRKEIRAKLAVLFKNVRVSAKLREKLAA